MPAKPKPEQEAKGEPKPGTGEAFLNDLRKFIPEGPNRSGPVLPSE